MKGSFRTTVITAADKRILACLRMQLSGFKDDDMLVKKMHTALARASLFAPHLEERLEYLGVGGVLAIANHAATLRAGGIDISESDAVALATKAFLAVHVAENQRDSIAATIDDIFGVVSAAAPGSAPSAAISDDCLQCQLTPSASFVELVKSTYDAVANNRPFVLVGPPLSGKTSLVRVAAQYAARTFDGAMPKVFFFTNA